MKTDKMEQLKSHVGKQICVHGTDNTNKCKGMLLCSYRHTAAESLLAGIVQKLRQAFDDVNKKGPYVPILATQKINTSARIHQIHKRRTRIRSCGQQRKNIS